MWIAGATREEFLEIARSGRPVASANVRAANVPDLAKLSTEGLQLIWRENPKERASLPALVLLRQEQQRDFLAWVLTYLGTYRPFTAYCRVADAATAAIVLSRTGFPSLGRAQDACLGLILGEVATYLGGQFDPRQFTMNACASTYSYAMARAMALKMPPVVADLVTAGWSAVRAVTRQPKLILDSGALSAPWNVLFSVSDGGDHALASRAKSSPRILDACADLYTSGDIASRQWESLTRELPEVREAKEGMHGSREERVVTFERAMQALTSSRMPERETGAFLSGYLASLIAPGSFEHGQLLSSQLRTFPSALLWYGLCAGFQEKPIVDSYAGGLGRRVLRDMLLHDDALDQPRCDISAGELHILLGAADSTPFDLRPTNPGHLVVELAPCVTTLVRWPPRTEARTDLFGSRSVPEEARFLLAELEQALARADEIQAKLAGLFGGHEGQRGRSERKGRKR